MKLIPLANGKFTMVDDEDYDSLSPFHWRMSNYGYALRHRLKNEPVRRPFAVLMHRQIMGVTDPKIEVDHKDRNRLNNQRSNLRLCVNNLQASLNRTKRAGTSSKYVGVSWIKKRRRWAASITTNGVSTYLGRFDHEGHAALMYDYAAIERHGEFASLNILLHTKCEKP